VIEITGLRNPCRQIDAFQTGLLRAVLGLDANGNLRRKTGVVAVVITSGEIRIGDGIAVTLPVGKHRPLTPV
jgi:MOSC domain-containing protein YiiM